MSAKCISSEEIKEAWDRIVRSSDPVAVLLCVDSLLVTQPTDSICAQPELVGVYDRDCDPKEFLSDISDAASRAGARVARKKLHLRRRTRANTCVRDESGKKMTAEQFIARHAEIAAAPFTAADIVDTYDTPYSTVILATRQLRTRGVLACHVKACGEHLYTAATKSHLLPESSGAAVAEVIREAKRAITINEVMSTTGLSRWVVSKELLALSDSVECIDMHARGEWGDRSKPRYYYRWVGDRRKAA
jgi:hypothetical protein